MQTPLLINYSTFSCGQHTNLKLAILRDFAEGYIVQMFGDNKFIGLRKNFLILTFVERFFSYLVFKCYKQ